MPKSSSSQPVKTRGKRIRKAASEDNVERDTDFKDESEQEEQQSPPRKRQRAVIKPAKTPALKKQTKGKQGRLAGLMNMPIDIFTEIASHLWPVDIINLARLNKFFHNMLMSRSSIHIWHNAMDNVYYLPACPPEMSEPRYLALVFLKTCTSCGKAAKAEVDTILRVRLCGSCRKTCLVPWNTVPPGIMALIPFSGRIARGSNAYSLREDVSNLLGEYERIKRLNDATASQDWAAERREIMNARLKHSQKLREYFELNELVRKTELEATKANRQDEIEIRLEELGWTSEDMDFSYPGCLNQHGWLQLVSQPKPLTERGWTTLKPRLIDLLEANRTRRLQLAVSQRRMVRQGRFSELLRAMRQQDGFTIEIPAQHPVALVWDPAPITVSYEAPFPQIGYVLNSSVVLDLYETDRTAAEMEAKFEQHRAEIERYITDWKSRIQAHCSKLTRQGPKVPKKILQSSLTTSNKPNPFANLSDDLKRVLRADSFFNTSTLYSPQAMTYGSVLKYKGLLGTSVTLGAIKPNEPPSLDGITWNAEANKVARELLTCLGIPNASYLEMTDKSVYACGRCHDTENKTWEEIVHHYVQEQQQYAGIGNNPVLSKAGIVYKNVHNPKRCTELPLVRYSKPQATDEIDLYECKVCADSLILDEVITSEEKLMQHLSAAHKITDPIIDKHYVSQIIEEPERSELDFYDSDEFGEFDEGDGCTYARDHFLDSQLSRSPSARTARSQEADANQQEKQRNRRMTVYGDSHTLHFQSPDVNAVSIKRASLPTPKAEQHFARYELFL
ncbi:hypothetical protein RSOL_377380 [Rhizoctonia solani AG-3 Rhs1AP]|uniref:F-box domain-containing protein n=2 Tax=Rhizoctonia solani TaxID=456999 RepID=X8JCC5_9AGAM|nr:hypothetical protein RSOL_377380 [Rhizoctonia solani AG-3 Rhs1AP]